MKLFLIFSATLNVIFLIMHELDACYTGEWKMFKFLRAFKERTQYLIFLYFHIPLFGFYIYYLWSVIYFNNFHLWIIVNSFSVFHLFIHLAALKWKSNVFKSFTSFFFISGAALIGAINLVLSTYY
ncbi:MAG: hypothetical protein KAR38_07565 [Calditrichia bacterium]|nr:hypothetical protein [Calditrichia bacterium]